MLLASLNIFYLQPLGAADYLALSEHFDVIILRNIPRMTVFQKTEARRFITLIDNLYDNRVSEVVREIFAVKNGRTRIEVHSTSG